MVARDGELLRAAAAFLMEATAYTADYESTGKRPGDPAYGITSTGTTATAGRTIAVDPRVIPLGSWVYIEGMGVFRAEDTGGSIKGNRIDIFMNDRQQALHFGRQQVKVYILEPVSMEPI